jgi:hypothetical protein
MLKELNVQDLKLLLNVTEEFAEALSTKLKEKEKNATSQEQSCSHFDFQSLLSLFQMSPCSSSLPEQQHATCGNCDYNCHC